ncbi:MAG: SDR family NAD(P)-dependent oxidoreductase [Actinobacteria bacterium]|nr:MAG: SDR family NAD(P)-dependent oxidoreductase [Actinomycetota bacterium]
MRTAVVTGASSGIGKATAQLLSSEGWRLLLVARGAERLEALADELGDASGVAVDLTDADAPQRVGAAVEERLGGELHLLVNNAGMARRAAFGDRERGGYRNVREIMDLNFDAVLRLTEELLPVLRASAPSSIVNVSSVAGRVARPRSGAYSASKFALAGWSDAATEGFPQDDIRGNPATRWMVSTPDKVARAILRAGPGGKPEVVVPRGYRIVPVLRALAPGLVRRVAGGAAAG